MGGKPLNFSSKYDLKELRYPVADSYSINPFSAFNQRTAWQAKKVTTLPINPKLFTCSYVMSSKVLGIVLIFFILGVGTTMLENSWGFELNMSSVHLKLSDFNIQLMCFTMEFVFSFADLCCSSKASFIEVAIGSFSAGARKIREIRNYKNVNLKKNC